MYDEAALEALIAAATLLGTDIVAGLFTNEISPTKTRVLADLTEPTYASYARQAVVFGAPFRDPQLGIAAIAAALTWQQTGTPTPCQIYGIFYATGGTLALMGMEVFELPIPLNDTLDAFSTVLEYVQSSNYQGVTTVIQ